MTIFKFLFLSVIVFYVEVCFSIELEGGHLRPDAAYVTSQDAYEEKLRYVFKEAYEGGSILQVMVKPSFGTEYVIGVWRVEEVCEVFFLRASFKVSMLERYERVSASGGAERLGEIHIFPQDMPKSYRDISLEENTREIDCNDVARIVGVWREELLGVRHSVKESINLDGAAYTYSMFLAGRGVVSGSSVNPRHGSRMDSLAKLVNALMEYSLGRQNLEDVDRALLNYERP